MEYLKSKFSNSMVVVRQELWDLILSASLLNEYSTCRLLSSPPPNTHTPMNGSVMGLQSTFTYYDIYYTERPQQILSVSPANFTYHKC